MSTASPKPLSGRIKRRLRRNAHDLLLKAANLCDPGADLGSLSHIEARVFTPRALGEPLPDLSYLFVGLCQIGYLTGSVAHHGCRVDHVLYDSSGALPPLDIARYDAAVIGLTLRSLLNAVYGQSADLAHARDFWNAERASQMFDRCLVLLRQQLEALHDRLGAIPIFVFSFLEPSFNYYGLLQPAVDLDHPAFFVRRLNLELAKLAAALPNVHVYDLNEAFNVVGRLHLHDDVVVNFSHAAIIGSFEDELDVGRLVEVESHHRLYDVKTALPILQRYIFRNLGDAIKVLRGDDRVKLIIVDLDDTLWRGVAAESEIEGWARIEGWPLGFAEALLYFKKRGGLLAIASKNDHDQTVERFRAIWGERLQLADFATVKINWASKAENIRIILDEVNLSPDQALFIDDNPREIAEVRASFPTLRCLCGNPRDWRRIILRSPETQVAAVSEESQRRTELVRARIQRDLSPPPIDRAAWLRSLELEQQVFLIDSIRSAKFARALELINKTNQFNTTGRRWSLAEMDRFLQDGGRCLAASLKDNTIDNGLISVALVRPGEIVQVVLSCRVFGLGAEAALGAVATAWALRGAGHAAAAFADTGANASCRGYFETLGFSKTADGYETTTAPAPPGWIRLELDRGLKAVVALETT